MKTNNKRLLMYSLLLIFIMACRAYRCTDEYAFKDDGPQQHSLTCTDFIQMGEPQNPIGGLECSMECPGIGYYKFDIFNLNVDFSELTKAEAQAMYCPAPQASSVVTEEPTEPPAEEPAPTEPPKEAPTEPPLASILDGKVSYCSVNQGNYYLNLPFNSGADPAAVQQELDNGSLTVEIKDKGTQGRCQVLAANNMLLCAFPATSFPAFGGPNTILNVVDKGTVIDVLLYSNYCEAPKPLNNSGSDGVEDVPGGTNPNPTEPPVCDPHLDPACPVDCANPANADLCG
jgi:hypothetical protein